MMNVQSFADQAFPTATAIHIHGRVVTAAMQNTRIVRRPLWLVSILLYNRLGLDKHRQTLLWELTIQLLSLFTWIVSFVDFLEDLRTTHQITGCYFCELDITGIKNSGQVASYCLVF
ncbi:hypothetical protein BS78_K176700 [Paspalum vaginatum]|uniref:Uncharacterized protein n=1 Tax=Paspalum vaginatum TaxID=158149 RepID=A0A9W8CDT3_9POAL|nr:hypothetical protein BS78_K176700 [Paspalum vaginatum]